MKKLMMMVAVGAMMLPGCVYDDVLAARERERDFESNTPFIRKITMRIGGAPWTHRERYTLACEPKQAPYQIKEYQEDCDSPITTSRQKSTLTRKELLKHIKDLKLGEWKEAYDDWEVLDGTWWELKIEFSNAHAPYKAEGSNAYPSNWGEIMKLLRGGHWVPQAGSRNGTL